jgi:drug/metabolite transporter (DMT)-like permease
VKDIIHTISLRIETFTPEKKIQTGLGLVLVSSFLFSLSNLLVKQATMSFSPFTVAFWRSVVGLLIILPFVRFDLKRLAGHNRKFLLLRGILGTLSLSAFFSSIKFSSLSTSVGLFSTYPIFTAIMGMLFFREKWRNVYAPALVFSVGGVLCIIRPDLGFIGIGELLGLTAAFIAGWVINIVRSLRESDSVFSIVFYFTAFATVVTFFPAGPHQIALSISAALGMFFVGVITTFAQILMTAGYTYCSATGGGIVSLLGLPFTLLLSTFVLGEKFDIFIGIGTLLIFLSGSLIVFAKRDG